MARTKQTTRRHKVKPPINRLNPIKGAPVCIENRYVLCIDTVTSVTLVNYNCQFIGSLWWYKSKRPSKHEVLSPAYCKTNSITCVSDNTNIHTLMYNGYMHTYMCLLSCKYTIGLYRL